MVQALERQLQNADLTDMAFEERLGLMVDAELSTRENKRLKARLRHARLKQSVCIEDVDFKATRGLDRSQLQALSTSHWIMHHQNVLIVGPTGVGKSFLACALAQKACRDDFSAQYFRASMLFHDLAVSKVTGRYARLLEILKKKDLLVIDDFGLSPLNDEQRRDLLEITEDRYEQRSTLIASQLPIEHWHEMIGDPTIADAILDRLIHNAYKIQLKGESLRKSKGKKIQEERE
jgi:DNA replication protein DnaC